MKIVGDFNFAAFDRFVLCTPPLPFNIFDSLIQGDKLSAVCRHPAAREVLLWTDPDLYSRLQQWSGDNSKNPIETEQLHAAVTRFITGMSMPTAGGGPPGCFTSLYVGQWGEQSKIELTGLPGRTRYVHLHPGRLSALARNLAKHPAIEKTIKYYPNPTIYYLPGDQLRYVKQDYKNGQSHNELTAVDNSVYLQEVLAKAAAGACFVNLVNGLMNDEISSGEAGDFIEELVENQVLVNELEIGVTGPVFWEHAAAVLGPISGIDDIKETVERIKTFVRDINTCETGAAASHLRGISHDLRTLNPAFELKDLFQTGFTSPVARCTLDKGIVEDVLKGIEILNRLSVKRDPADLKSFKERFVAAYGQEEVPLLQALDSELGVGYNQTDSRNNLPEAAEALLTPRFGGTYDIRWDRLNTFLFRKFTDSLKKGEYEITLTDEDLAHFDTQWDALPDTISVVIQFAGGKEQEGEKEKIVIDFVEGPASRFAGDAYGNHSRVRELVKTIAAREEEINPGAIHARFVQLPEPGIPGTPSPAGPFRYEIPHLAGSTVPGEFQIKLEDLLVSVRNRRLVLRSKRLNKEVLPRLSPLPHSYHSLPVSLFFSDLQARDAGQRLEFNWGALENGYKFLPRVCYKNIILSPARWNFNSNDINHFFKTRDEDELRRAVGEWRKQFRIPNEVFLKTGDQELYLHLESLFSLKALLSAVKENHSFRLKEFIFDPGETPVKGGEDVFVHRFVLSFYNRWAALRVSAPEDEILTSPSFRTDKLGLEKGGINVCFAMPDHFNSFIRTMGLHIVGNEVARETGSRVDFAYLPDIPGAAAQVSPKGLSTLYSKTPVREADIIGFSIPNPMVILQMFRFFELSGIPVYRKDRTPEHPLIIAGNSGVLNPAPFENFIDAFVIGDGEKPTVEITRLYEEYKNKGKKRTALLEAIAELDGVYVPAFTERKYNEKGELIDVIYRGNPEGIVHFHHVDDLNKTRRASLLVPPYTSPIILIDYSCQYKCAFCQMSNSRGTYKQINSAEIRKYLLEFDGMGIESVGIAGTCVGKQHELEQIFEWSKELKNVQPYIYGSLRVDDIRNVSEVLPEIVYIAPETGNDYLRNKILLKTSKRASIKEDIRYIIKETPVNSMVMCHIAGIPTETEKDHEESIELFNWTVGLMAQEREWGEISLSIDPLLPQPGTPFEEHGMIGPETFKKIVEHFSDKIKSTLPGNIRFNCRHINTRDHLVEGIANTGDRWTGDFLLGLYNSKTEWNIPAIMKDYNERIHVNDSPDYIHRGNWKVKPWKMIDFGNSRPLEKAKALIKKNSEEREAG